MSKIRGVHILIPYWLIHQMGIKSLIQPGKFFNNKDQHFELAKRHKKIKTLYGKIVEIMKRSLINILFYTCVLLAQFVDDLVCRIEEITYRQKSSVQLSTQYL